MIRYTVLWRAEAEGQLAKIWCDSVHRGEITAAADQIESVLRSDAANIGIALPEDLRSIETAPLKAYFHVDEADRKVLVVAVRVIADS